MLFNRTTNKQQDRKTWSCKNLLVSAFLQYSPNVVLSSGTAQLEQRFLGSFCSAPALCRIGPEGDHWLSHVVGAVHKGGCSSKLKAFPKNPPFHVASAPCHDFFPNCFRKDWVITHKREQRPFTHSGMKSLHHWYKIGREKKREVSGKFYYSNQVYIISMRLKWKL